MARFGEIPYDRAAAVAYANEWAYRRNPLFYDFSEIGGDCTNFASQCVYAGCEIMNFTPIYGWYYINLNNRAPAWTSVTYFHRFLTTNQGAGPYGSDVPITRALPGDVAQIRFRGSVEFDHSPVIVQIDGEPTMDSIYIAAHSNDANCRPLSSYQNVVETRFIHIEAARYLL